VMDKDTLVIIPARGGSKGLPGKNIKLLNGKPLILYTLEAARKIFSNEQICVSTDDEEIKKCVENSGLLVPFLRPDSLATDGAGTYEVLLHALDYYESQGIVFKKVVLLQPTSPFRDETHILGACSLFTMDIDMVVSVKETKSNPYYLLFEEDDNGFLHQSKNAKFTRRQDCPTVWEYNGAIYVINVDSLRQYNISSFQKKIKYEMDGIHSLDIDNALDWAICETIIREKYV